jgi:hypothetical protein
VLKLEAPVVELVPHSVVSEPAPLLHSGVGSADAGAAKKTAADIAVAAIS